MAALLMAKEGAIYPVSAPLAVAVHPNELVAVTVYIPVEGGVIMAVVAPVFHE
jgi:hypothetical protein